MKVDINCFLLKNMILHCAELLTLHLFNCLMKQMDTQNDFHMHIITLICLKHLTHLITPYCFMNLNR